MIIFPSAFHCALDRHSAALVPLRWSIRGFWDCRHVPRSERFSRILDHMDLYPHYESLFLVYLFYPCITKEIFEMINCGASSLPDGSGFRIRFDVNHASSTAFGGSNDYQYGATYSLCISCFPTFVEYCTLSFFFFLVCFCS